MDKAVELFVTWAKAQPIAGMKLEVVRLDKRTPLIFIEVPASDPASTSEDCVLLYGHLDKQPEMTGWAEHLGPWKPVIEGDKLYGRGGADDGYAIFGSLAAIAFAAGTESAARALRGDDRSVRGIRQLRPAVLRRSSRRAHRQAVAGRLPRFRLRQLRSAVADDVAARHDRRQPHRARARRRRAFGRRVGHRRVELPHAAAVAVAARRRESPARSSRRNCTSRFPQQRIDAGEENRAGARRRGVFEIPVRRRHEADGRRSHRTRAQSHVASGVVDHRHRRHAAAGFGGQRAASVHRGEGVAASAADARRRQRRHAR